MDWISSTYNKLEGLAIAADRFLGIVVERCEGWMAGRRAGLQAGKEAHEADASMGAQRPGRPFSA